MHIAFSPNITQQWPRPKGKRPNRQNSTKFIIHRKTTTVCCYQLPLFTRQKWVDSTHFISFHFSGDKRKAMFCHLRSPGLHMLWAEPGHLPILILNGQNIAIPSFVPAPVVGGEFSCPRGAGASATIQQLRITHDAAMRNSHYLIQENWYIEQRNQIFYHWSFYVYLTLT